MRMRSRYETLDTLRGVAALAVVAFHLGEVKLAPELVPHGYLAVDFFFALSGFVVAHAYENALLSTLSWRSFAWRRAIRLYPLAVLGAALGLGLLVIKCFAFPAKVDSLPLVLVSGVLNAFLLPMPFGGEASRHELFPGDGPLWTLFFELGINLAWGAFGTSLRTRTLTLITATAGVAVAVLSWRAETANLGFDVATAGAGLARVCFGFPLGVILFRLLGHASWPRRLHASQAGPAIIAVLLLVILAMPRTNAPLFVVWDLLSITILLPVLLICGMLPYKSGNVGGYLGELSYPIYVLHFPVLLLFSGVRQTALSHVPVIFVAIAAAATSVIMGLLASRFYDRPIRRWLSSAGQSPVRPMAGVPSRSMSRTS